MQLMKWNLLALLLIPAAFLRGQSDRLTTPPPDERMKADILLIVAHPDDETAIGGYLARAVMDERRRVAIVYCNRGTGGGNTHGGEQSNAMGAIREIEARRATAAFGITNVWFLGGRDTPGQDLFASLQAWRHGAVLEELVRLIRLTRPEVVLTWLPHFVGGENHGDHQAAGVLATEAFDLAGDPTSFPAQVAFPRERTDIGNAGEGLRPWQPKKLYFFSDASHPVAGAGPAFDLSAVSPARGVPYYRLAADLHTPHLTQGDVSRIAIEALRTGDFGPFRKWLGGFRLLFGKGVVPCTPEGDVFDGITAAPSPFVPPPGYTAPRRSGISIELGGPFAFYRDFQTAHGIERIAGAVAPEIEVAAGSYLHVPILLSNATPDTATIRLTPLLPTGWKVESGGGVYVVPPGAVEPAQLFVRCPEGIPPAPVKLGWQGSAGGKGIGEVSILVNLVEWSLPQ